MRKLMNFFAAVLLVLAAVGCEKSESLPDISTNGKITLTATINNGGTRTSLGVIDNGQYPVLWSQGDAIAVINNGKLFQFTLSEGEGTTNGTFICGNPEGYDENALVCAFYPYAGVTFDAGVLKYNVPERQAFVTNSFAQGAMPMAAYSHGGEEAVTFNNLFGVLKLQLTGAAGERVKSIEVTSSSHALSGPSSVTIEQNKTSININEGYKKVVLDISGNGIALHTDNATEFLIALPEGAAGLGVMIHTTEASYYKTIPTDGDKNKIVSGVSLRCRN